MSTALALNPEQFIFAQDSELKTTSLKISEAFGKRHDHVIRDIKKTIDTIKDIVNAPKFGEVEYIDAKGEKRPMYEMDKDGFMLVVMSYTGAKAMAIKVAYINAFNFMQAKLFPKRYGLVELPEPPTINKAQIGILYNRVKTISGDDGKMRSQLWSRFQNHFNLSSYKDLPADKYDEAIEYLDAKEVEYLGGPVNMLYISSAELEAKIQERVKALEGELLEAPKPEGAMANSTLTIDLSDGTNIALKFNAHAEHRRYFVDVFQGNVWIKSVSDGFICTGSELAKLIGEPGMIGRQHLPSIIEAAARRLKQ